MVKKLVNGEVKDLTDVNIGGIKVYKCTASKSESETDFNQARFSQDLETSKENTKQKSVLGSMSIFN